MKYSSKNGARRPGETGQIMSNSYANLVLTTLQTKKVHKREKEKGQKKTLSNKMRAHECTKCVYYKNEAYGPNGET